MINRKAPFFLEIAKGEIDAHSSLFKFGRSTVIGTTESIVWDGGGNYTFLEAAETMDVISDSADDAAAGTGARTIIIYGLDADYNEITEIVTLNGLTIVTTTKEFLRVYRALVITSGTNDPITDANKGDVTITSHTTTELQAKILTNNGQTLMAIYTVPAGKKGYVTGVSFVTGQGKQCLFKAKFRNGPTAGHAFSVKYIMDLYQSSFFGELQIPLAIPEKTDIVITGQTTSGTLDAAASFGLILIDNA